MNTRTHTLRRVLSLVLVVVMAFGLMAVGASAATEQTVRHYNHYVCIGDSIAAGYGPYNDDLLGWETVPEAYHSIIANATGASFQSLAHVGMRTEAVRALIEDGFHGDAVALSFNGISTYMQWLDSRKSASDPCPDWLPIEIYNELKDYYGPGSFYDFYRGNIQAADLITVGLGLNDLFLYATKMTGWDLQALLTVNTLVSKLQEALGTNDIGKMATGIFNVATEAGLVPFAVADFLKYMRQGYQDFYENWLPMMEDLHKLSPNATIVAVNLYNPFGKVKLTEDSEKEIGKNAEVLIARANQYIEENAEKGGYLFADVRDTEICDTQPISNGNFIHNILVDCHPTEAGHQYIADQIFAVLPERGADDPTPVPSITPKPTSDLPFVDVHPASWYHDDVKYVYQRGIMQGMSDTIFGPELTTTRGQFATVLYRLAGSPSVAGKSNPFRDLTQSWYRDAITWAYNLGIVTGTSATTFEPDAPVTREQMTTMLWRGRGSPNVSGSLAQFSDAVSISSWALKGVLWSVQNGIINGMENGTFQPQANATRAQLSAILHRFHVKFA